MGRAVLLLEDHAARFRELAAELEATRRDLEDTEEELEEVRGELEGVRFDLEDLERVAPDRFNPDAYKDIESAVDGVQDHAARRRAGCYAPTAEDDLASVMEVLERALGD